MKTLIKILNILSLNLIIIYSYKPIVVFGKSDKPPVVEREQGESTTPFIKAPVVEGQEPQRATVSGSRGSCPDYSDIVIPLFPKTENINTKLARPTFLFELKSSLSNTAYFSLVATDEIYPLYEQKIDNASSGLLAFKLPPSIELTPNKAYRLTFVIVCNEKRPSHNWLVTSLVTRLTQENSAIKKVDISDPVFHQAVVLSQTGLWFDALELIYEKDLVDDESFNSLLENFRQ